jgi:hypothetical protein
MNNKELQTVSATGPTALHVLVNNKMGYKISDRAPNEDRVMSRLLMSNKSGYQISNRVPNKHVTYAHEQ